jgi:hypothetical protein
VALVNASFVEETTTTTGTGTLSLGGATSGNRTFVAAVGDGNTCYYGLLSSEGQYEAGVGTVTDGSPATLARTSVVASSTGAVLDLPAGTHQVYCALPAELYLPNPPSDGNYYAYKDGAWVNITNKIINP